MRCGLMVPNFGPFADPLAMAELASDAEGAGWDGVFLWDHMAVSGSPAPPVMDPWVGLAAIATATSRIRLGTVITPIARRRPWKLARETVTLDLLSRGRLTLGAGLGFAPELEFAGFGEEPDARARAAKLDEGLAIVAGLWSGNPFSHDGEHFSVTDMTFRPRPVQQPRIPVWIGGWWPNPRPFRRAAAWDGVVPELVGGRRPTPADVWDIAAFIGKHRTASTPFDIVIGGHTDPPDSGNLVRRYARSGVTWWLERIDPDRLFSLPEARRRILDGPPVG